MKKLILSVLVLMGASSQAATLAQTLGRVPLVMAGFDWKVGDSADYTIAGGVINGTMHMFVREMTDKGYWMQQDADLGFIGKQKIESLIDKNTGEVLEFIVNGQKQTPPDPKDAEVVDSHKDHIRVPKGEFDCLYAKIHSKKENSDTEIWIAPNSVPVGGMLKTIAATQMGPLTVELTDFKKN